MLQRSDWFHSFDEIDLILCESQFDKYWIHTVALSAKVATTFGGILYWETFIIHQSNNMKQAVSKNFVLMYINGIN